MTGFAFSAIRAGDYGIHIHLSFSFFVRIIGVFGSFRFYVGITSFLCVFRQKNVMQALYPCMTLRKYA